MHTSHEELFWRYSILCRRLQLPFHKCVPIGVVSPKQVNESTCGTLQEILHHCLTLCSLQCHFRLVKRTGCGCQQSTPPIAQQCSPALYPSTMHSNQIIHKIYVLLPVFFPAHIVSSLQAICCGKQDGAMNIPAQTIHSAF